MTKRRRAEMLRAADDSQKKGGTISVALGRRRKVIGTTEQGQGTLGTLQSMTAMVIKILKEEADDH